MYVRVHMQKCITVMSGPAASPGAVREIRAVQRTSAESRIIKFLEMPGFCGCYVERGCLRFELAGLRGGRGPGVGRPAQGNNTLTVAHKGGLEYKCVAPSCMDSLSMSSIAR